MPLQEILTSGEYFWPLHPFLNYPYYQFNILWLAYGPTVNLIFTKYHQKLDIFHSIM